MADIWAEWYVHNTLKLVFSAAEGNTQKAC